MILQVWIFFSVPSLKKRRLRFRDPIWFFQITFDVVAIFVILILVAIVLHCEKKTITVQYLNLIQLQLSCLRLNVTRDVSCTIFCDEYSKPYFFLVPLGWIGKKQVFTRNVWAMDVESQIGWNAID